MNISVNPTLQEGKRLLSRFAFEDAPGYMLSCLRHYRASQLHN